MQQRDTGDVAVILAAGASRRLGRPKQCVVLDGRTLVVRAVNAARGAGLRPLVVLGAHREQVAQALGDAAPSVFHAGWAAGMGGSLAAGLRAAMDGAAGVAPERVVCMVCDQPWVTQAELRALVDACTGDVDASAARYEGRVGVPACFAARCLGQLLAVAPEQGARRLLRSGALKVQAVPMEVARWDIDTEGDIARAEAMLSAG